MFKEPWCRLINIVILPILILTLIISFASTVLWCIIRFYEFRSGQVINVLLNYTVRIIALVALLLGIVWFEWKFAHKSKEYDYIVTKTKDTSCPERRYLVLICCLIIIAFLSSIIVFILDMIDQAGVIRLHYHLYTRSATPLCSSGYATRGERYAYTVLSFLEILVYVIINILMVVATAYIGAAWQSAESSIGTNGPNELYNTYDATGKFVSVVQGAFQPWFVLQWIAYFVGIFQQSQSIKTIIDLGFHINDTTEEFVNHFLYCIVLAGIRLFLNLSLFVIPYGCGILMNKYHDKYIKKLKNELRQLILPPQQNEQNVEMRQLILPPQQNEQNVIEKKRILSFIIKHTEYRFTPSIAGIYIPLDSVGHQLTILITIIAPLLS